MSYNYDSPYKNYANLKLPYFNTDSHSTYKKNLATRYDELLINNWIDKNFTYQFNSLGFRSEEFTTDPSIMFLGCSFTSGVGLPIEYIFPEIVAKNLNLKCANLGVAGGSSDCAFRLCHGYIDKINPKIIVFMTPPHIRFELVTNKKIQELGVWVSENPFYKEWTIDNNNDYFNHEKNLLAIQAMCIKRNIKLIHIDSFKVESSSLARDLEHPGIDSHKIVADHILSLI